jgi:hypothetical protein
MLVLVFFYVEFDAVTYCILSKFGLKIESTELVQFPVYKTEITAVGISRADHATPLYPQKLALTSPTSGSRSVGLVRSRTKATEVCYVYGSVQFIYSDA